MKFQVLAAAELEASTAAIWYDGRRPALGDEFIQELAAALERVRSNPLLFGKLEKCPGDADVRRCALHRFPYVIIFRYRPEEILVVAVCHVRRKPFYWVERLA